MILIVGFTKSNRTGGHDDYVPMSDGYRSGAEQVIVPIRVPNDPAVTAEQWAEAVFVATNAPREVIDQHPGAPAVAAVIAGWAQAPHGWRSLSKGDTVLVYGKLLACASVGFTEVQTDVQVGRPALGDEMPARVLEV